MKIRIKTSSTFVALLWGALVLSGVFGYVLNIIKLAESTSIGGMELLRAIGAFAIPLGAVLGYF